MSKRQEQLKRMAEQIYAESDKCETRQDANYYRRNALKEIDIKERWMVKEYVSRIGRARQRSSVNYRESWAIAQDKKEATKKAPSEDEAL